MDHAYMPSAVSFELDVTADILSSMNIEQAANDNRDRLTELGGVDGLAHKLGVNIETGLTNEQVLENRKKFGTNEFPATRMTGYCELLFEALNDTTLIILLVAAAVSFTIDSIQEGIDHGWIEGGAIFIAVFLVSNITAGNNYVKALQFRAIEQSTNEDERCSVYRDSAIQRINPRDLVVGDIIVLQAGDSIPADSIICDNNVVYSNESNLTGEPEDRKKSKAKDCFLLSSCLLTDGDEIKAMVFCVGSRSQWGKIKANLVTESVETPLQEKLGVMTEQIGYIGMSAAFLIFIVSIISIWARDNGEDIKSGFLEAFILCVTIVVVAIPEGLPLAVTISLAYSMRKMKKDQCLIRVLAACETMGNATNICSDKTGTLTLNVMTVVEGWFASQIYDQDSFIEAKISEKVQTIIAENCAINRTAYLVFKDSEGRELDKPMVIGNKTEGALIFMIRKWGFDYQLLRRNLFDDTIDRVFAFNSVKKRSSSVVHRADGSVRLYCKGASEVVLKDCSHYMDPDGNIVKMSESQRRDLENHINTMADQALRTLLLAHKDYPSASALPSDWHDNPPDGSNLCCDCIVGIIDPLRPNVKEAVAAAQMAGVQVRMVTGDNLATAKAIARKCGILTEGGIAMEGPTFRNMTPKEVDAILPRLQVLARSSPDDKFLLVTRLNGHSLPANKDEWTAKFANRSDVSWDTHRDLLMPGYKEEWEASRPEGGQVVGVTGDGTNDAPALKAGDVGLAMGLTGTKVARAAADIVLLDDDFNSIVKAILWGRAIYDNIRKFLQFQLTVNVVALLLVFIGVLVGFETPITPVQMLWVNLIMDSFGALALGTEEPTPEMLLRKPYKRSSSLISYPMRRNILVIAMYQLIVLLVLLFEGPRFFGVLSGTACGRYDVKKSVQHWDVTTGQKISDLATHVQLSDNIVSCSDFSTLCDKLNQYCYEDTHQKGTLGESFKFEDLNDYEGTCLSCQKNDYTHGTIMFNTFIFFQIFNEYTARSILSEWNVFKGLGQNHSFLAVSIFTLGCQIFLVELGGDFVRTSPLTLEQWLITIMIGFTVLFVGIFMRLIPVEEDPNSFFDVEKHNGNLSVSQHSAKSLEISKVV